MTVNDYYHVYESHFRKVLTQKAGGWTSSRIRAMKNIFAEIETGTRDLVAFRVKKSSTSTALTALKLITRYLLKYSELS